SRWECACLDAGSAEGLRATDGASKIGRIPMPHASRVALITGCGKPVGIGNSTARALAAKGVAVVVSDVRPAGVANEHNHPDDLDTNWGGVDSLVEQTAKAAGPAAAGLGVVGPQDG